MFILRISIFNIFILFAKISKNQLLTSISTKERSSRIAYELFMMTFTLIKMADARDPTKSQILTLFHFDETPMGLKNIVNLQ